MREKSWIRKPGESSGANGGNLKAEGKARKNGIRLRYKSGGTISTAIQSPRRAGFSFLVISFTSENNCLVRVFPLFSPPQPTRAPSSRILVRFLTLSPSSCLSDRFSATYSRNYKLSAISSIPGRSCCGSRVPPKKKERKKKFLLTQHEPTS